MQKESCPQMAHQATSSAPAGTASLPGRPAHCRPAGPRSCVSQFLIINFLPVSLCTDIHIHPVDLFLWGILTSSVPFIPKGTSYPEMTGFSQSLQHSNPPARCEISPCPGREGTRCVAPPTRLPGQLRPALEASPPCQGFEGWINTSRPVGLWELLLFSSTYYKVYYF